MIPIGDRCEQPWAAARYAAEGSYAGYLADLDRLRAYTEQQHDLAISLCCTLIAGSIRSLSGNLSPELLVGLVTIGAPEGKWSSAAALEHIRQNPDAMSQAKALRALLQCNCEMTYTQALEVACAIAGEWELAEALQALAPHLPPDLLPDALAAARAITSEWARGRVLQALAPHLPPNEQPAVYAEALATARAIADEWARVEALQALAPHPLPGEQPTPVAAHEIADKQVQAVVLQALCLPPSEQPAVFAQAFAVARAIRDEWARAAALRDLAPHLPSSEQPTVYAEALATACAVVDRQLRVHALRSLAPQLARNSNISSAQQLHLWHTTIHTLAARGRPRFLRDLAALTPWLAAIASPEELAEIAIAIRDVGRCWP